MGGPWAENMDGMGQKLIFNGRNNGKDDAEAEETLLWSKWCMEAHSIIDEGRPSIHELGLPTIKKRNACAR